LGSATLLDDSIDKWFCEKELGQEAELAFPKEQEKTILRVVNNSHGRLFTEDRQDDVITNCRVGQEVGGVSWAVRRLFRSAGVEGVGTHLCSGPIVRGTSKDGRGERPGVRHGSAHFTAFPGIEQGDEEKFNDRCQQIVAKDHAHPAAIGVVDESAVGKSGDDTVGVGRQWDGNRGKVDNCVVGVHLCYATPDFECLLASGLYLPEDWANDPLRRKKTTFPTR
jgi:hypothetical protein